MCVVKRPKIEVPKASEERDPPILRNPFLDGLGSAVQSIRIGRNMLRIDPGSGPGRFVGTGGGGAAPSYSGGSGGGGATSSGGGSGGSGGGGGGFMNIRPF